MSTPVPTVTETLIAASDLDGPAIRSRVRKAREAGLISQAGHGRAVARATDADGVNIILAAYAAERTIDVPEVIKRFRSLTLATQTPEAFDVLTGVGKSSAEIFEWMFGN